MAIEAATFSHGEPSPSLLTHNDPRNGQVVLFRQFHELTPPEQLHHLEGKDLGEKIAALHTAFEHSMDASGIRAYVASEGTTPLAEPVAQRVRMLLQAGERLRRFVNPSEADTSEEALSVRKTLQSVAHQYEIADAASSGRLSKEQQAAARIGMFEDVHIATDVDNTITDHSPLAITDGVDPLLLGSALADPLHGTNRKNFVPVYAAVWEPLVKRYSDVYFEGGKAAPLREGFAEFLSEQVEQGRLITAISTNFRPFVEGVLSNIPGSETFKVCAAYPSVLSAQKADVIKMTVLSSPNQAVIYIGDGTSDLPSIDSQEVVALYFALEDSTFAKQLEERGILHFTYRNGHDIREKLAEIKKLQEIVQTDSPQEAFA